MSHKTQPSYADHVLNKHFSAQIQDSIKELLNYKLTLIKSIMSKRYLLGYDYDTYIFDKLYSSDVDILEQYDMEYEEQCMRYIEGRKNAA